MININFILYVVHMVLAAVFRVKIELWQPSALNSKIACKDTRKYKFGLPILIKLKAMKCQTFGAAVHVIVLVC